MNLSRPSGGASLSFGLITLSFLVVAVAIVYFSNQEIKNFEQGHSSILKTQVDEAANDVVQFLESRQALVETFAFEKQNLLFRYSLDVEDYERRVEVSESLARWLPYFFTFTIADKSGTDLVDDVEGFVGPQCQMNIQDYVKDMEEHSIEHAVFDTVIHPQANNYHFDVMAPWLQGDTLQGVFFVSFHPRPLAEILNSHQSTGHYLALINVNREPLIEINGGGARDEISATRDINLSDEEVREIRHSVDIKNSQWRLVGYLEPGLVAARTQTIVRDAAIMLMLILVAWGLTSRKIIQLSRAQARAFDALEQSNTELSDMAEQQRSLRKAAEAGEEAKAQFLASMSHEIRTPLNAVIGLTDLVLKTDLNNHQHDYLKKVSLAGRNLLGLINDILDFSKIEAGKLEIENIDFEIDPVLENVAIVTSTKADQNDTEIIITVDRAIPNRLIGDPLRIGQVLINLVGNAAKFTENGEIVIDIGLEEEGDKKWLSASVEDNGIGMTEDQVAKLFQAFQQADKSVTRTHGGTGLGLSISQQLVKAMDGEIGATSEAGVGSRFYFKIPIQFAEGAERRDTFEGIDPRTIRLLVVDDNETVRDMLQLALQKLRFIVDTAASGAEAIKAYEAAASARPYNALLIDWKMDDIDGLETVKRIRALDATSERTPVISMFSSSDMAEISDELEELGVEHALQKPINTSFLVDALMVILQSTSDRRPVRLSRVRERGDNAHLGGLKVLLVEDNDLNQMVAEGVLENLGCVVDVAENGQVAMDLLRQHGADHYAIVLMDIQMPVMDGLSATRAIRSELNMPDIPIVAMTAHALEEERERCVEAGMDDHISKPIDARDVKNKIVKWAKPTSTSGASDTKVSDQPAPDAEEDTGVDGFSDIAARLMIPEEVVRKLMTKFVEDYADAPVRINALIADEKLTEAEHLAHSIKGVSGSLGLVDISQQAGALEDALKNGTFDADTWDGAEMTAVFEKAVNPLRKNLGIDS